MSDLSAFQRNIELAKSNLAAADHMLELVMMATQGLHESQTPIFMQGLAVLQGYIIHAESDVRDALKLFEN